MWVHIVLKRIQRLFRRYRYRQVSLHLIPQILLVRDPYTVLDQNRLLARLLTDLLKDQAVQVQPDLMQIERINGPYQNLEEAYAHALTLQRHLDQHLPVDIQLLTFANQSIAARDWFKNHEGYYLTDQDLLKWLDIIEYVTESLDNLSSVDSNQFQQTHHHLVAFCFRIRDVLTALYQFYMLNWETV